MAGPGRRRRGNARRARRGSLVRHRPVGTPGALADVHPEPDLRQASPQPPATLGELVVEDHGRDVGVVPQVPELVVGVPVIRVDRHQS